MQPDTTSWLSAHSSAINLTFSAVVAIATVVYAVLTHALVTETRQLRKAQTQPQIGLRVQSGQAGLGLLDLILENVGLGPAYDLRFTIERDGQLEPRFPRRFSDISFLKHGVPYLAPRQSLSTYLLSLYDRKEEELVGASKLSFIVRVQYRDALGTELSERYEIGFSHLVNIHQLGDSTDSIVRKTLQTMAKSLDNLSRGSSRLKVVTSSPDDVDKERASFRAAQVDQQIIREIDDDRTDSSNSAG